MLKYLSVYAIIVTITCAILSVLLYVIIDDKKINDAAYYSAREKLIESQERERESFLAHSQSEEMAAAAAIEAADREAKAAMAEAKQEREKRIANARANDEKLKHMIASLSDSLPEQVKLWPESVEIPREAALRLSSTLLECEDDLKNCNALCDIRLLEAEEQSIKKSNSLVLKTIDLKSALDLEFAEKERYRSEFENAQSEKWRYFFYGAGSGAAFIIILEGIAVVVYLIAK